MTYTHSLQTGAKIHGCVMSSNLEQCSESSTTVDAIVKRSLEGDMTFQYSTK